MHVFIHICACFAMNAHLRICRYTLMIIYATSVYFQQVSLLYSIGWCRGTLKSLTHEPSSERQKNQTGSTFMAPSVGFLLLPSCDICCCCVLRKSTFTCGGTRRALGPTLLGSKCRWVSLAFFVVPELIGGNQKLCPQRVSPCIPGREGA